MACWIAGCAADEPTRADAPARKTRAIESLLAEGKLQVAEQRCALMIKAGTTAQHAAVILTVAAACFDAGRSAAAAEWLSRLPQDTPPEIAMRAARMARDLGKASLACDLFAIADAREPLGVDDALAYAQAALAAAEQMRQVRGRQGAWAMHEQRLQGAERMFRRLATSDAAGELRARAWLGLARVLRLQRAGAQLVADALQQAAKLQGDQSSGTTTGPD